MASKCYPPQILNQKGKGCRNPPPHCSNWCHFSNTADTRWPCLFPGSFLMAAPKDLACFKGNLPRSLSMLGNRQSMLHRRHLNTLKAPGSRSYYFSILQLEGGGLEVATVFQWRQDAQTHTEMSLGDSAHCKFSLRPVDLFLCWRPVFLG